MKNTVILVTKPSLGTTAPQDADFGVEMLDNFLHTLERNQEKPTAICFYTEGVRTVVRGAVTVLGLRVLEKLGTRLVSCRSCLDRYGLSDQVAVGEVGTMVDIVTLMAEADKVITI